MPLVLNARNNGNYGGNLINQKYSPLQNIILTNANPADYSPLFTNRRNLLSGLNTYPPAATTLEFFRTPPAVVTPAVAPLVVVSSNRAEWMRTILDNAASHGAFTGYDDATTFNDDVVPWYAPGRSGRQAYIVVHWSEFDYYEAQVGGNRYPDVTVVGYRFQTTAPTLDIVGFGASRFAALQYVISTGYQRAWAVDDNVVNINGFPQQLATVEALMTDVPPIWGIGFGAATANVRPADLYLQGTVNFNANALNFGATAPGLLQQVVLWNLNLLGPAHVNYSPLFVASNEDVSLSNYLQQTNRDQRIITACTIVKVEPTADSTANVGAHSGMPRRRNRLLSYFANLEGDIPIDPGVGGQRALSTFITDTVLHNRPRSNALVTQSQAVEQVMSAATMQGWLPPANPFNPYAGAPVVQMRLPAAL